MTDAECRVCADHTRVIRSALKVISVMGDSDTSGSMASVLQDYIARRKAHAETHPA